MVSRLWKWLQRSPVERHLAHPPYVELAWALQGHGDDRATVEALLLDLERRGQRLDRSGALRALQQTHPHPHWVNYLLCMDEATRGLEEVTSYPPYVWMDISSICSVECRFCKYTHDQLPKRNLTLDEIRRIEWFKYVRVLNLTAGTAEAITNPQFVDIFEYLRDRHPHLHLSFLTNGRTLNEMILNAIAGRLDALHVSMNASSEEDYNRIIARGSWTQFSNNMRKMREILGAAARPTISASFVMLRWNLDRALAHLEFAVAHGASLVLFHHYYPHYVNDIHHERPERLLEKIGFEESLYFEKERADEMFTRVRARGRDLGVEVITPPLSTESSHVAFGVRSLTPAPTDCFDPWTKMYLLWGFKSRREEITICCGLAADIGVYFDRDEVATSAGLMRVRNSPTLRAYRRTVNGARVNPICEQCRKVDRFAPDAVYPDQRTFFEFNGLPLPPHFQKPTVWEKPLEEMRRARDARRSLPVIGAGTVGPGGVDQGP